MNRPTVGIFGLTGCAGDQLVILNCEDELLALVEILDVRDFLMASSARDRSTRLELALVEGSVMSRRDEETLRAIRERSQVLVALGTCAMYGGVPAMDRDHDREALLRRVYGKAGESYDALPARPLHDVVSVDHGIPGCPVEKREVLDAIASLSHGDPPLSHDQPVCMECRLHEHPCLLDRADGFCLGPVTVGGCDARCPAVGIGCVGCRGPSEDANPRSLLARLGESGMAREEVERRMGTFADLLDGRALAGRGA